MLQRKPADATMNNQKGFTLIEVLVALSIFTIGILSAYTMQVHSMGSIMTANSVSTSANWATYVVEDLLALEYDDPLLENDSGDTANGLNDIDDIGIGTGTPDGALYVKKDGTTSTAPPSSDLYRIYWNIADNHPLEDVKFMRVIVIKSSGLNQGKLYSHDYYKYNNNI